MLGIELTVQNLRLPLPDMEVLGTISKGDDEVENVDAVDAKTIQDMLEQSADAYVARNWDKFTSFFTDDAVWMPPGQPPLIGKNEWWSWIGGRWDQSTVEQIAVSHEEIVVAGDWAYEWHNETQIGPGWQRNFKGIFIMHRQEDGSWRIARYCFNHTPVADS